ncbi:MAG TPA: hypothetical protein VHY36_16010 [Steroidobacteraceae bacterium]|jgi:hypothetical protein|nr:hypothetical protein [Steroidobacteraceae bacterium]
MRTHPVGRVGRVLLSAPALIALSLLPVLAQAQLLKPLPHAAGHPPGAIHPLAALAAPAGGKGSGGPGAATGTWTPLTNQISLFDGIGNPILLSDGSVLVQDAGYNDWYRLTPDQNGSYVNGTWTQIALAPYNPLYHSTEVLPDGRMVIEGGEYLCTGFGDPTTAACNPVWTNLGAIYDPVANAWTSIAPPDGWTTIGDAQSIVLPDGTYMQANCCTNQSALLNPRTLTWTPTGAGKFDPNDEEGWTLLPNDEVLVVDAYVPIPPFPYIPTGTNSEVYSPWSGMWSSAGSTSVQLWDSAAACGGENVATFELGPGVLRPDGTVFYEGANSCGPGNTAIYDSRRGKWRPGPQFPGENDAADAPAALEPNGNVLTMVSPGFGDVPSTFLEWDGHKLSAAQATPNAANDPSYFGNMLVLPTGQIMLTDFSNDIEIYTPVGGPRPDWRPVVVFTSPVLAPGHSYSLAGIRMGGMSQGAAYGDDAQGNSNFPLVRITNLRTGHVFYGRTHDFSVAVASNAISWTRFEVPAGQEPGLSQLQVVASGIASSPVTVLVLGGFGH